MIIYYLENMFSENESQTLYMFLVKKVVFAFEYFVVQRIGNILYK